MLKPENRFPLNSISLALLATLATTPFNLVAQESEDEVIDEVVTTGTRLKGTATAVLEERKNQAFVADILGAEQISRTGDGDAASALRRVTGLTLVDGQFIYVRGLGERYSSTALNGASVPSPDPTRNVIPLDLFPSDIIESLSVQKSYSPSMPAAFGGGSIDIRIKTIPTEYTFSVSGGIGWNTENSGDAFKYAGNDDTFGADDGLRAAPASIVALWQDRSFFNQQLDPEVARNLLLDVNRNYDPVEEDVGPDGSFNVTIGNSYDLDSKWRIGFLSTIGYDKSTQVSEQFELNIPGQVQGQFDPDNPENIFDDIQSTQTNTKWSALFNFGIDYDRNHRIDYSLIALNDTEDEIQLRFGNTQNIQLPERRARDISVLYEERRLITNQLKGVHTFPKLNFLGFDWKYSNGRSYRDAPGNFETRFLLEDENGDGIFDTNSEISLTNASTAARYSFQILHDRVENFGYNFTLPYMTGNWEMEFKAGADFVDKARTSDLRRFDIDTRAFADSSLLAGSVFNDIVSDELLTAGSLTSTPILRNTTIAGDDYVAGQKIDAYYFEADFFYDSKWRFTGGVRWEDYRLAAVPFDPASNQIDLPDEADRNQLAFQEDDFYPAFALTYFINPDMQLRASIGETVVRPDIREVVEATFIDPLTEFPVRGTPGLETTSIINYDLRWEWYRENGNNISVGLFYKDMDKPIESIQAPAQDGPPLVVSANAETGEVYGVELEFLQGLDVFGGGIWDNLFVSGNITLSDSEIEIDRAAVAEQTGLSAGITNLTRRLTGHSEYVVNMQLGFDDDAGEHSASLVYNVFGDRILFPGLEPFDDNFEKPFHSLDLVYKYYPNFNTVVTFKWQNMLDEVKEIEFDGALRRSETKGSGISLSVKYDFN